MVNHCHLRIGLVYQKGNDPALMDPSTLKSRADGIYGEVAYYFLPRLMPGLLGYFWQL